MTWLHRIANKHYTGIKVMTKKKKSHLKLSKRRTGHVKNFQYLRLRHLSSRLPRSKKSVAKVTIVVVVIIAVGGAIPFPYTFAKTVTIPFTTDSQQSAELELNDSKIIQEGVDGTKTVQVSSFQSLWGRIFGLQPVRQKEITSTVSKPSIDKVVIKGTKKYQYMLCSDGSYRYYTDQQFKESQAGFTSKSKDNCKENNQGHKAGLTNSKPSSNATSTTSTATNGVSYEAQKTQREVEKLKWCTEQDEKIGNEYIGKVQQAQATQGITNEEFNAIVEPAYWKYSLNIGLLKASGCTISNPYPDFTRR